MPQCLICNTKISNCYYEINSSRCTLCGISYFIENETIKSMSYCYMNKNLDVISVFSSFKDNFTKFCINLKPIAELDCSIKIDPSTIEEKISTYLAFR